MSLEMITTNVLFFIRMGYWMHVVVRGIPLAGAYGLQTVSLWRMLDMTWKTVTKLLLTYEGSRLPLACKICR